MSDLISREAVENITWEEPSYSDPLNVLTEVRDKVRELPSADIMECARAIKEYCERFSECEGCRFYNNLPFRCMFGICPQEWNLPTPWADNNIFEKGGNDDNT